MQTKSAFYAVVAESGVMDELFIGMKSNDFGEKCVACVGSIVENHPACIKTHPLATLACFSAIVAASRNAMLTVAVVSII